jgi:nitroimidazol reductase NimA-like FMN-containing flavoprotein (pyridoxamine 5'-phosphate oxidase superfamily)
MENGRYGVEMNEDEVVEFLVDQGHGVLSFGGEPAYGLPISFGYDVVDNRCIFQLLFPPGSQKREYVERSSSVNLVSYDWSDPDDWQSVVIRGPLDAIPDDSVDAVEASEVFAEHASVPGLAVFDGSIDDLDPEWHELRIEDATGRQSPQIS